MNFLAVQTPLFQKYLLGSFEQGLLHQQLVESWSLMNFLVFSTDIRFSVLQNCVVSSARYVSILFHVFSVSYQLFLRCVEGIKLNATTAVFHFQIVITPIVRSRFKTFISPP